jgi:hypothetical protein
MKVRELARVVFKENVNTPGMVDGKWGDMDNAFPQRGAVSSGGGKPVYRITFAEGWVTLQHPVSLCKLSYPWTSVKEALFAEDLRPEATK